ncbi:MAG: NusG domain II-containing protein [bacterium]
MNRRQFIKQSAFFVSGMTATALTGPLSKAFAAKNISQGNFALNVITDDPGKAVPLIEDFIKSTKWNQKNIRFSEHVLSGNYVGDLVMIHNNILVNYHHPQDEIARRIWNVARELGLPKTLEQPKLLQFRTEDPKQSPKYVNVFRRNILIHQFDIDRDRSGVEIHGSKGGLVLSLKEKQVKILSATCKHQTCVKMGSMSQAGQNLVCIPNEVRISMAGENSFGVDSVSY